MAVSTCPVAKTHRPPAPRVRPRRSAALGHDSVEARGIAETPGNWKHDVKIVYRRRAW
jgi:hypothetical protein